MTIKYTRDWRWSTNFLLIIIILISLNIVTARARNQYESSPSEYSYKEHRYNAASSQKRNDQTETQYVVLGNDQWGNDPVNLDIAALKSAGYTKHVYVDDSNKIVAGQHQITQPLSHTYASNNYEQRSSSSKSNQQWDEAQAVINYGGEQVSNLPVGQISSKIIEAPYNLNKPSYRINTAASSNVGRNSDIAPIEYVIANPSSGSITNGGSTDYQLSSQQFNGKIQNVPQQQQQQQWYTTANVENVNIVPPSSTTAQWTSSNSDFWKQYNSNSGSKQPQVLTAPTGYSSFDDSSFIRTNNKPFNRNVASSKLTSSSSSSNYKSSNHFSRAESVTAPSDITTSFMPPSSIEIIAPSKEDAAILRQLGIDVKNPQMTKFEYSNPSYFVGSTSPSISRGNRNRKTKSVKSKSVQATISHSENNYNSKLQGEYLTF